MCANCTCSLKGDFPRELGCVTFNLSWCHIVGTETKRVSFRNLAIGQFSDSVLVLGSNHEIRLLFGKNNFEWFFFSTRAVWKVYEWLLIPNHEKDYADTYYWSRRITCKNDLFNLILFVVDNYFQSKQQFFFVRSKAQFSHFMDWLSHLYSLRSCNLNFVFSKLIRMEKTVSLVYNQLKNLSVDRDRCELRIRRAWFFLETREMEKHHSWPHRVTALLLPIPRWKSLTFLLDRGHVVTGFLHSR